MTHSTLALLSGKGGSGKTIIALSMSKLLSEAGQKVLLVDLDIATHGATYWFENDMENATAEILCLHHLLDSSEGQRLPLKTSHGFDFIPSTSNILTEKFDAQSLYFKDIKNESVFDDNFSKISDDYGVVILDCQAGYSRLVAWAAKSVNRNLLVLESDAVTAASVRVLFLRLGAILSRSKTWQIYNKLTEEERGIYEKMEAGALFPNLPPIPFDWQVRAAFALGQIPNTASIDSAFGLGVLRVLRPLIPGANEALTTLERETVGDWYYDVTISLSKLEEDKKQVKFSAIMRERLRRLRVAQFVILVSLPISAVLLIAALGLGVPLNIEIWPFMLESMSLRFTPSVLAGALALLGLGISVVYYLGVQRSIRSEQLQDVAQEKIEMLDREIERFQTLLRTDPQLREYAKRGPPAN